MEAELAKKKKNTNAETEPCKQWRRRQDGKPPRSQVGQLANYWLYMQQSKQQTTNTQLYNVNDK